jgi:thiosulfate/3-mercaptopyruvate sulfurtransferase
MSDTFLEIEWLQAHASDPLVRIVDTRSKPHGAPDLVAPTGAEQYAAGHIPGAIHLDYAHELADPATPYTMRVAPAESFARTLGAHGIGDEHTIVAYDDGDVPYAARFVWMCRYYGRDDVRILAGGFKAWRAAAYAETTDVPTFPPAIFSTHERPTLRASRAEVIAAIEDPNVQLLETQRDKTYALRDRDIAGTTRLSGSKLLLDERGGRIAPKATLDALVADLALDPRKRTILTCGSGVSASGAYLALLEAGFNDLAVYDGSWLEWSHDGLPTVPKPPP